MSALGHRLYLRALDYEKVRDSRCVFTYAYSIMTRLLARTVDRAFQDPPWIADLAEAFAGRYFAALDARESGAALPASWKAAFEGIDDRRCSVAEALVFGITVHIIHDLPLALADVGFGEASAHLSDYDAVNEVMGRAIEVIRDHVTRRYNPGLRFLDRLGRPYDAILRDYGVRMSRGLAWYNASRLSDALSREKAERSIEHSPMILIHDIRSPPSEPVRLLLASGRFVASLFRRWPARGRSRA